MRMDKIIAFAKKQGYDGAEPRGEWKQYEVYEPMFDVTDEEDMVIVGHPLIILVDGEKIRMSTEDEAHEYIRDNYDEEDDEDEDDEENVGKSYTIDEIIEITKFNPYHDRLGRFTSGNGGGMKTFSANPETKAGKLAIEREKQRMSERAAGFASLKKPSEDEGQKKIAAAETRIKGMLKEGAVVKLSGIDPEMVDSIADNIELVLKKYPSVKNAFAGFTSDDTEAGTFVNNAGVLACFSPASEMIHFNKEHYANKKEMEKAYGEALEKKHFPAGTTADSVVVHEMGHAIDYYVSKKTISWDKFFWQRDRVSTRLWDNDIKNAKKNGEPLTGKSIREGLSGYAGTKPAEYIAEGFAEFMTSKNPRPMAQSIGKRLETYIKKAAKVEDD